MNALPAFTFLLLLTVVTPAALAQDADTRTGSARGTQGPVATGELPKSDEAWSIVLKAGQVVKVRDETGRTTRGKVVSISDTQLIVARQRLELPFAKEVVRSIDLVDSPWNGGLIGAVATASVFGAWVRNCESEECVQGRMFPAVIGPLAGFVIGGFIDERINRRLWESQRPTPRVTLAPWLDRDVRGVMAQVRF